MKTMISMTMVMMGIFLSACSNNQVGPPSAIMSQFPLTIGSTWTYAIYDSIAQQADTVKVTAYKQISASSSGATHLWSFQYRSRLDSVYVVAAADTVNYYSSLGNGFPAITLAFPMEAGQPWHSAYYNISVTTANVSVPAGSFLNSYQVFEVPHEGNFYGGTTYWLVPRVGIVKEQMQWFVTVNNERENTTWQLLSYSIAQ